MSCAVGCTVLCFETDKLERASGLETSRAPYSSHKTSSFMRQIQGVKVGTTKPQWPRLGCKYRSRSGAWKPKHLVQRQWRVEGAELKNCVKIPSSFYSLPFPELLHHTMWLILVDLAGFICSVILLSAGPWPVLPVVVFFLEEHGQSGVKRWCLNSGCPCF